MSQSLKAGNLSLNFPDGWKSEHEAASDGWTLSLFSPGATFVTLVFDESSPDAEELVESALGALRAEHPGLEEEALTGKIAERDAVGYELHFFSLDLTCTARTWCFSTERGTALLLWQSPDVELEQIGDELQALCDSIQID